MEPLVDISDYPLICLIVFTKNLKKTSPKSQNLGPILGFVLFVLLLIYWLFLFQSFHL